MSATGDDNVKGTIQTQTGTCPTSLSAGYVSIGDARDGYRPLLWFMERVDIEEPTDYVRMFGR